MSSDKLQDSPKVPITTLTIKHLFPLQPPRSALMLKHIPPLRAHLRHILPKRALHITSISRVLSPSDKLWIAPSDADPSTRDYTLAFRAARLPKPATAETLPQICRSIINSNPNISVSSAIRKTVERAGYTWENCGSCEKTTLSPREQDSRKAEDVPALLVLPFPMVPAGPSFAAIPRRQIKGTYRDLADLSYQFNPSLSLLSTIERGIYVSTLWKRLLPLFKGTLRASIHKILPDEEREAQIEKLVHRFEVSGCLTVVFIHAELTDENSLPLVSREVEECDYINATNGLWSPVLAILSNGLSFQYFIYNSITAPTKISASMVFNCLRLPPTETEFGKDTVEGTLQRMYYVFLCGYINGIKAQIQRISVVYGDEEDRAGWALKKALEDAEWALEASKEAIDGNASAEEGVEALARSADYLQKVSSKLGEVNRG
ncbi:hypothetical protein HOY82DRAFT_583267 [Tuber indicum]|nr:hypothetical protein HOY82DRAFT_583267 [Tuber indicum]